MFWESNPTHTISDSGGCFAVGGEEIARLERAFPGPAKASPREAKALPCSAMALPDDAGVLLSLAMALRGLARLFL